MNGNSVCEAAERILTTLIEAESRTHTYNTLGGPAPAPTSVDDLARLARRSAEIIVAEHSPDRPSMAYVVTTNKGVPVRVALSREASEMVIKELEQGGRLNGPLKSTPVTLAHEEDL